MLHAAGFSFEATELVFRTQRASAGVRPDISGVTAEQVLGLLVEGKFWAGFTEAQPVEYIRILEQEGLPGSGLAFLVPDDRVTVAWAELVGCLSAAGVIFSALPESDGTKRIGLRTDTGIHMMITSWEHVVAHLELAVAADPAVRADVLQLRAVCSDMRQDARAPFVGERLTDLGIPHLVFQFSSLIQDAVGLAASRGIVSVGGLRPQSSWERIGRYAKFAIGPGFGFWIGADFRLWLESGATPVWLTFSTTEFGNAPVAHKRLTPFLTNSAAPFHVRPDGEFSLGLEILAGVEHRASVEHMVDQLSEWSGRLAVG